ncbi:MAG: hypothetical protein LBP22_02330 [Deltaproteobacteria bacterium]|jgi:hypothetical protein|nr:hypothetical protein [Deltaproteobacteria bacterium]
MLDVLRKLNKGKDRSVLIGRNALNFHYNVLSMKQKNILRTQDFDLLCPDVDTANECRDILESVGFEKRLGTFFHPKTGEIDIVLADQEFPTESVVGGYFNLHGLRELWDARENNNGVIVPNIDCLIMNKLLFMRENEGKDAETIGIYFSFNPERLDSVIDKIVSHGNTDRRDKMLYSLYEGVSHSGVFKQKVELVILNDIERQKFKENEPRK